MQEINEFLKQHSGVASVNEVATLLGLDEGAVRRWARDNDVRRLGAAFAFDHEAAHACADDLIAGDPRVEQEDNGLPEANGEDMPTSPEGEICKRHAQQSCVACETDRLVSKALDYSPIKGLALSWLVGVEDGSAAYGLESLRQAKERILAMPFTGTTPSLWVLMLHRVGLPIPPVDFQTGFGAKEQAAWCEAHAKMLLGAVVRIEPAKAGG